MASGVIFSCGCSTSRDDSLVLTATPCYEHSSDLVIAEHLRAVAVRIAKIAGKIETEAAPERREGDNDW